MKRGARGQTAQPLQRRSCSVVSITVERRWADERVEGIAFDAAPLDGDEAQSDEAGHAPSIQSARRELRDRHAVRRAAQEIENGLLPGLQRRAGRSSAPAP